MPYGKRGNHRSVRIWNQKGELSRELPIAESYNQTSTWGYDRDAVWVDAARLAVPAQTGAEVWNIKSGKRETVIDKSPDVENLTPVIASPDGRFLLCREARGEYENRKWRTILLETKGWTRVRVYHDSAPLAWSADSKKIHRAGQ